MGNELWFASQMGDFEGAKTDSLRALELDDEQINAHLVLGRVRAAEK